MMMNNISNFNCFELDQNELLGLQGGGPLREAAEWYYKTVGSFYRGIYDGLMGNERIV